MSRAQTQNAEAGFTLLELLIAITLLGFISLALFGALRFGTRVWERAEQRTASIATIARVQALLRRELAGAYPAYVRADASHGAIAFDGTAERINFIGPAPLSLAQAGRARIEIARTSDETGLALILRAKPELARDDTEAKSEILIDHLTALNVAYFGEGPEGEAASWQERWKDAQRLPRLIRIEAQFESQASSSQSYWPPLIIAPVITADVSCRYDPLTHDCEGR